MKLKRRYRADHKRLHEGAWITHRLIPFTQTELSSLRGAISAASAIGIAASNSLSYASNAAAV